MAICSSHFAVMGNWLDKILELGYEMYRIEAIRQAKPEAAARVALPFILCPLDKV
ncbi:predicted protein [Sclerotinia sclerotiorum 1980 UF-70]|uniref:Uncharacterized protein n=1 Tax=Sclerotinia sclerotiorum (strain ATCC 18683 / 1980 / Ss-1) TaxID=665079 RepID=A7ESJ8_SCLS1|nr:predicted protein [Sclerotinia sclerotiorum 1980 UF-70]EDN92440.1 predicted protein [Sclerotinia sclerotiorum 1980 UF-70]